MQKANYNVLRRENNFQSSNLFKHISNITQVHKTNTSPPLDSSKTMRGQAVKAREIGNLTTDKDPRATNHYP